MAGRGDSPGESGPAGTPPGGARLPANDCSWRALVESLPDGVLLGHPDLGIAYANPAAARLLGAASPNDLLGRTPADFLPASDLAVVLGHVGGALAGGDTPPHDVVAMGLDGVSRILEAKGSPFDDGGVRALQVVLRDVTVQRTLAARLSVAARLGALGTLVGGVAHEVNNPLAGLLASGGFALEELRELRDEIERDAPLAPRGSGRRLDGAIEALVDAQAAGQRIARIVRDLATLGRTDAERLPTRLADVVAGAMRWIPAAEIGQATVRVEAAAAPEVAVAPGQIQQVVVQLVTNAARAIPRGRKGTIVVRTGPGRPGTAALEVSDDGAGMPPDVLARIFDPFFTTRDVGKGMGLGLPICHAIVTSHGGSITAKSTPGAGSTFTVELPAAA